MKSPSLPLFVPFCIERRLRERRANNEYRFVVAKGFYNEKTSSRETAIVKYIVAHKLAGRQQPVLQPPTRRAGEVPSDVAKGQKLNTIIRTANMHYSRFLALTLSRAGSRFIPLRCLFCSLRECHGVALYDFSLVVAVPSTWLGASKGKLAKMCLLNFANSRLSLRL